MRLVARTSKYPNSGTGDFGPGSPIRNAQRECRNQAAFLPLPDKARCGRRSPKAVGHDDVNSHPDLE